MPTIPEHPEIACALATGYPKPPKEPGPVNCTDCGLELTGADNVFIYDNEPLCENCCRDRIEEEFDMSHIAKALGIAVKEACAYMEEETYG